MSNMVQTLKKERGKIRNCQGNRMNCKKKKETSKNQKIGHKFEKERFKK